MSFVFSNLFRSDNENKNENRNRDLIQTKFTIREYLNYFLELLNVWPLKSRKVESILGPALSNKIIKINSRLK